MVSTHKRESGDESRQRQIQGPGKSGPRLLAVATPGAGPEQIVRWTRRLADSLNSPWLALYVETPRALDKSMHEQITSALTLAEKLGAEVVTTTDDDLVHGVLRVAAQRDVTQIVVGRSWQKPWQIFARDSFRRRLIGAAGDFEVHVVPTIPDAPARTFRRSPSAGDSSLWPYGVAIGVVAAITLVAFRFGPLIGGPHAVALVYMLAVMLLGSFVRRGPTLLAATLSALL